MTVAGRRWVMLAGVTGALVQSACGREQPATAAAGSVASRVGQWIWTREDAARFSESRAAMPALRAAVFVGTITCDTLTHRVHATAALPPSVAGVTPVEVVIRFTDGLDRCRVPSKDPAVFDAMLGSAVSVLRARVRSTPVSAVQLDYDVPSRAVVAWARSVRALRAAALQGDSVWVTSLIAQLRVSAYGDLFRDVVDGHVLQVFDTGEPASDAQVAEAVRVLRRAGMRYRIGLGAFERETRVGLTEHRRWFRMLPELAAVAGYDGVWIFPAGNRWVSLLEEQR